MTAANMIVLEEGVLFFADTSAYQDGVIVDIDRQKISVWEEQRMGFVFSGCCGLQYAWPDFAAQSFDDAFAKIGEFARGAFDRLKEWGSTGSGGDFGITFGGWSDQDRCWAGARVESWDTSSAKAFKPVRTTQVIMPRPLINGTVRHPTFAELTEVMGTMGLKGGACLILESQRRGNTVLQAGRKTKVQVGGRGELVAIHAGGVGRETLIRWDDHVGERPKDRIERIRLEPEVLWPIRALSRAERRRHKRAA